VNATTYRGFVLKAAMIAGIAATSRLLFGQMRFIPECKEHLWHRMFMMMNTGDKPIGSITIC
jgi:hypothetical protein